MIMSRDLNSVFWTSSDFAVKKAMNTFFIFHFFVNPNSSVVQFIYYLEFTLLLCFILIDLLLLYINRIFESNGTQQHVLLFYFCFASCFWEIIFIANWYNYLYQYQRYLHKYIYLLPTKGKTIVISIGY